MLQLRSRRTKMANATSASSNRFLDKIQFNRKVVLGEGNSIVYEGTYGGKNVAVKRILLNPSITGDCDNFEAQMKLDHENVLIILAVEVDRDFRYIALELCSGSLFQVIEKTYKGPPLPTDREVLYQIVAGLEYIHSLKLAHRDIKPENILISMQGQIKLSEFGLKRHTKDECYITGMKGTLLWMAPEQFQGSREEIEIEITQKSDVFSCGCVFFVFLTRENGGIHPFGDTIDHLQIYANIQEGISINIHKANHNHSLEAKIIEKMIQRDPVKRITAEDVKNEVEDLLPFPDSHVNPPNYHQPTKQRSTFPTPVKQRHHSPKSLNRVQISNNRRNPDYHPWLNSASKTHKITDGAVNVGERGESDWKLNYFDSRNRSCDSNNNEDLPLK